MDPQDIIHGLPGHHPWTPGKKSSNSMYILQMGSFYSQNFKTLAAVMIQSLQTDRSGQTVQTQIRLLLEEQSDQGLHCLLFHLHLFDEIP